MSISVCIFIDKEYLIVYKKLSNAKYIKHYLKQNLVKISTELVD